MAFVPFQPDVGVRLPRRRAGFGPPFTPLSLTNLRAWYKSDVGITIATGVSQWDDQSGNGNHLVQGTGGAQPVVTAAAINGLPAITFDGADDFMQVVFTLAQPCTVFLVGTQVTWTATDTLFDGAVGLTSMSLNQATASARVRMLATTAVGPQPAINWPLTTYALIATIWAGAAPNSILQTNSFAETTGSTTALSIGGITIGANQAGLTPSNISVAEIIVMGAAATTGERDSMRAYSQARYGVGA